MDCGPDNFCHHLIPSSLLWYVSFQGYFFAFSFRSAGEANGAASPCISSDSKVPSAPLVPVPVRPRPPHGLETCQHALLALFTTLWAQHACSDTPYNAAATLDGGEKDARLYLFRHCSYPSIHSVLLLCAKTDRDHLMVVTHLIMLQTTLILWIQCLKRFSKICSEEN